jgi:hypothetical protein
MYLSRLCSRYMIRMPPSKKPSARDKRKGAFRTRHLEEEIGGCGETGYFEEQNEI